MRVLYVFLLLILIGSGFGRVIDDSTSEESSSECSEENSLSEEKIINRKSGSLITIVDGILGLNVKKNSNNVSNCEDIFGVGANPIGMFSEILSNVIKIVRRTLGLITFLMKKNYL